MPEPPGVSAACAFGALSAAGRPVGVRLGFEHGQARVIVRELLEMRPGDLPREAEVVVRHIRLWVPGTLLQLHFKAAVELLKVDLRPVYAKRGTNSRSPTTRRSLPVAHCANAGALYLGASNRLNASSCCSTVRYDSASL